MAVLGLSILIATISFFCYRNPPTSWPFLSWFRQPAIRDVPTRDDSTDVLGEIDESQIQLQESAPRIQLHEPSLLDDPVAPAALTPKAEQDRRAMPPPPLLLRKPDATSATPTIQPPSPPDTPKATASSSSSNPIPSFALDTTSTSDDDEDYIPSFPARNSAQRAMGPKSQVIPAFAIPSAPSSSSSRMLPPALPSFPAMNSAQRTSSSHDPIPSPRGPPRLNAINNAPSLRSPTLMSPPMRSPLPNRGPSPRTPNAPGGSSFGLFPPPSHTSVPSKPSKKVQLTPGHSPLDWAALSSNPTISLNGLPPGTSYLRVPPSLLKTMNGRKDRKSKDDPAAVPNDAWTVLGGKVYNITPYIPYHPGGEPELMKCAGRDGTKLFAQVHPWVNWEGMLEGCLVGVFVTEEEGIKAKTEAAVVGDGLEDMD